MPVNQYSNTHNTNNKSELVDNENKTNEFMSNDRAKSTLCRNRVQSKKFRLYALKYYDIDDK